MQSLLRNQTISLEIKNSSIVDEDNFLFDVINGHSVVTPQFSLLSANGQIATSVIGWINGAVFTYMRSLVYKFIFKEYKSNNITPVNILTLIVCFVQHSEIIWGLIHETLMLILGNDFSNIISPWYCKANFIIKHLSWYYSVIGSLGIAIYRMMLIKCDLIVQEKIGAKRLMWIILRGEVALVTFLVGTATIFNPFRNPLQPACFLNSDTSIMELLDDYMQSLGHSSLFGNDILLRSSIALIVLILEVSEIAIYVVFFHHMYKHDNTEQLKKLLGVEVIKHRNRKNAMSFFSLFCSFLAETVFFILQILLIKFATLNNGIFMASILMRKHTLCVMALVEVFTSSQLRSMVFK